MSISKDTVCQILEIDPTSFDSKRRKGHLLPSVCPRFQKKIVDEIQRNTKKYLGHRCFDLSSEVELKNFKKRVARFLTSTDNDELNIIPIKKARLDR